MERGSEKYAVTLSKTTINGISDKKDHTANLHYGKFP